MGRISKRKTAGQNTVVTGNAKRYQAGIYARLSSAQGDRACGQGSKTESVELQIKIAKKYVEEFNQQKNGETMEVVGYYTDLGKTGSNFEREGFLELLQDIRLGKINCVIVKDLSRFGRNYLEAGNYIEKIFPFLGVRFIAVSDGFDTGKAGNETKQMASEIKNLVNDMYAKDFSKKAKVHLKQRREEGSYVGGAPPYGYVADWDGKRRILIPDEQTAAVVRFIYEKFVETESYTTVVMQLNQRKINPPAVYKKTKEVYAPLDEKAYKGWDRSAVERILKSDTYSGTLVQGKTSITARDEKNRIQKTEEEWVVTKDAQKPLVDMEIYLKAAEIRQKAAQKKALQKHPSKGYPIEENIFHGILSCGVCGKKMIRSSYVKTYADGEKARMDSYFCLNSGRTKVSVCPDSNRIAKAELAGSLLTLLRLEFAVFLDKPENYMEFGRQRILETVQNAEAKLRETEGKIRRLREEESDVYMAYRAGRMTQKDYVSYQMKQEDKWVDFRKREEGQKKERAALKKRAETYLSVLKALLKLKNGEALTKDMIETFISKINVYPGKRIEVLFAFTAGGMEGMK